MRFIGAPLAAVPTLADLPAVLSAPLLMPIHVDASSAKLVHSFPPLSGRQQSSLGKLVDTRCSGNTIPISEGASEDAWGAYHGQYLIDIFNRLAYACDVPIVVDRNKAQQSDFSIINALKRPDCSVRKHPRSTLLLDGEEKLPFEMEAALAALRDKIGTWNVMMMGEMPYLLCYATAGGVVHFFAMDPGRKFHQLLDYAINVLTIDGVLQLTLVAINMFRLFRSLLPLGPPAGTPGLNCILTRRASVVIFKSTHVVKIFFDGTGPKKLRSAGDADVSTVTTVGNIDMLESLYRALAKLQPTCLEYPLSERVSVDVHDKYRALVVELLPIGIQRKPKTSDELCASLRSVLAALDILHGLGFVHLDPRWENVVFVPEIPGRISRWCLIDYGGVQLIDKQSYERTPNYDLKMVARELLQPDLADSLSVDFSSLRALLLHPDATVCDALRHPFLCLQAP